MLNLYTSTFLENVYHTCILILHLIVMATRYTAVQECYLTMPTRYLLRN